MAGFGLRERGFNIIISWIIVSHYSAAAFNTVMREGCLLRGGRDICCCSCDMDHSVDSPSLILLLFLVSEITKQCLL